MAAKKSSEWPRKITVGNVTVKVYRQRAPRSKTGFEYVLAWRGAQGRERKPFSDAGVALDEAQIKAERLNAGQIEAAFFSRADRDELVAARQLAGGVPLLAAMEEWARARQLTNGAIIAAAEAWSKRHATTFKRRLAPAVVDEFIAYKIKRGKRAQRTYASKLKPIRMQFATRFLDDIAPLEWANYFARWTDGVTSNDFRKRAVELCRWARDVAGYLPRNVPAPVELTERANEAATEIGILTPETWAKILAWVRANRPEHLAAVVLAGFFGLRSDEIHGKRSDRDVAAKDDSQPVPRQKWEDIDFRQGHVNVTNAKTNTPAWRLVPMGEVARRWLELCPGGHTGPVCEPGAMEKVRVLLRAAGFALPENCFRHSYITHEIAVSGDKAKVATWAGNSVREIDKRYRRPVPPEVGRAWFATAPDR